MPKKKEDIRAFCPEFNTIILIRRLTERSYVTLFNKLVKIVKSASSDDFDFVEYVKAVISGTLTPTQKKEFTKSMKEYQNVDRGELAQYKLLGSYYRAIVEYYAELRIEYVCGEVNEIIPESLILDNMLSDTEFQQELEKETKPKKKRKKKFEFSKLEHIQNLEKFLKGSIIGQDEAIETACNAVKLKAANFSKHINLFFIGKTGRGKSQLAKNLGSQYSENFWLINCAEFANGHEINRLLGSPPGYIGSADKSMLKEKSDKGKRWTIVFDEIEKANSKLFNLLLSLMDTGTCSDNLGNHIDLSESIFIFTSNCGLKDLKTDTLNFINTSTQESNKTELIKSMEKEFSPEFRGRIDEVVFFNDLTKEDVVEIAKLSLKGYPVKITPELIDYVVEKGFSDLYGARNIERTIKKLIALPLADQILSNKLPSDGTDRYDVAVVEDEIEVVNTVGI